MIKTVGKDEVGGSNPPSSSNFKHSNHYDLGAFFAFMQLFSWANWGGHDLLVGLWGDFANDFANFSAVRCLETLMRQGFQRIRACK